MGKIAAFVLSSDRLHGAQRLEIAKDGKYPLLPICDGTSALLGLRALQQQQRRGEENYIEKILKDIY